MSSSKPTKRERISPREAARRAPASRGLAAVVGDDAYGVWVGMLSRIGRDGRTHRLAVVVASMLQHAVSVASEARRSRLFPCRALLLAVRSGSPRIVTGHEAGRERRERESGPPSGLAQGARGGDGPARPVRAGPVRSASEFAHGFHSWSPSSRRAGSRSRTWIWGVSS